MSVVRSEGFRLEIELEIEPGTTAALLGPNGAGKSTAVEALAGLLPIDDGWVELDGRILDHPAEGMFVPAEERQVGVVFQDYLLFPHLSVVENIAFGPRSRRRPRPEARALAGEWAQKLGLDGMEGRQPGDLSGGQAQRAALARALASEPGLLLLDEPLAALDVTTRVELRRVLADHLRSFEGPRLLITHDPTEAFLLADEIYVIEAGVITQVGSADEIRLRPRTKYAADLAGSNLISGTADDGRVDANTLTLSIADHDVSGPVLLTIHPTAVSVHLEKPEGSQRNIWRTAIEVVENLGDRARLQTGGPLRLTVEVTREASSGLSLRPGAEVWVAVKATEIGVELR